jgi:hypothetical protein
MQDTILERHIQTDCEEGFYLARKSLKYGPFLDHMDLSWIIAHECHIKVSFHRRSRFINVIR